MYALLRIMPIACTVIFFSLHIITSNCVAAAFPLNPGSSWTYRDLDGNLETMIIKGTIRSRGIPLIETSYGSLKSYYYIITDEGLFRLQPTRKGISGDPMGELVLLAQRPLEPGRTWQSPWSDPPLSFEVLYRGPVSVAAGNFPNSIKIGYRPVEDPIFSGFIWINPDIGILAQEQSGYRSELVSYSLTSLLPPAETYMSGSRLANLFQAPPVESDVQKISRLPVLTRFFEWFKESGVPFSFFLMLLVLFSTVVLLIMRSRRMELDLEDNSDVIEGEYTLASAMVQEGLYEEAIRILQKLTTRHPQWPDVAASLGKAYRQTGKLDEASLELKRALTLNPDLNSARLELVRVYIDLDNLAQALAEVDVVLTEGGRFADALYLKGELLRIMGKDEMALEAYREALAINPEFRKAQEGVEKVMSETEQESTG
jgi:tetratricopeptide (TPR) repeat protein